MKKYLLTLALATAISLSAMPALADDGCATSDDPNISAAPTCGFILPKDNETTNSDSTDGPSDPTIHRHHHYHWHSHPHHFCHHEHHHIVVK